MDIKNAQTKVDKWINAHGVRYFNELTNMAILTKDTTRKQVVDLTGPQGNAFYLLGLASKLCKQMQVEDDIILQDMKMGGYEHLITTFDDYFGDLVDLERQMTKQEILDRVQDILNQEGNVQALDLLRHDLELDVIVEQKFNEECG